ncbi:hypothetical protein Poly24_33310 [Rosistilla carotiformis]|uniref:DUF1009 domain-containing protein n=1 Tax=Rosistilla carotiformis TaxID=2528017 RepID=A0A518JVP6_9BACT|nr:UDP-2,3-diacylglucosamine diphosphatase LpxI [Rosistilla carotiformis]QDV69615.1 hypothetical protein Poly24_33310 [Rosistilla carotiformis]
MNSATLPSPSIANASPSGSTVGLIAGWGRFPILVAESLKRQNHRVACAAIRGHACESLNDICDEVRWFGVAKMGGQLRFFRRHGVQRMTMAGKLFKADLMFQGSVWLRHLPDLFCIRTMAPHFITRSKDTRDDTLLTAVTDAYLARGIEVCPATDFAPELLVKQGHHSTQRLNAKQQADVRFGWTIAKQMGGLDIGQSITVKDQTVVAVEAVEGTDACIERSGKLCGKRGFTLIKVAKPQQDMRFDVPTIGPQTIELLAAAGGSCIVIEADKTIVVDREEVTRIANAHRIAIVAVNDAELAENENIFAA